MGADLEQEDYISIDELMKEGEKKEDGYYDVRGDRKKKEAGKKD